MDDFSLQFKTNYPTLEGLRLNLILAADGQWVLGTRDRRKQDADLDLRLIGHLRSVSDLIVATGETIRRESYTASKWAPIAVLSKSASILAEPLFADHAEHESLLITSNSELVAKTKTALKVEDSLDIPALVETLEDMSFKNILLETGPSVTALFEPFLDEICLTSPNGTNADSLLSTVTNRPRKLISQIDTKDYSFSRFVLS